MPLSTLADATALALWANRRRAQDTFPELVRRLIRATLPGIARVSFPSGEGVQLGGWDGEVIAEASNELVPSGVSLWELGTTKNTASKADADYDKRKNAPGLGTNPKEAVFVFVTLRRWKGKKDWAVKRRAENFWRDVRALDADDLESWLQSAAAVHVWLSSLIGIHPEGADDVETVWRDWSEGANPALSPAVLKAGRETAAEAVATWLAGQEATLTLRGDSETEAIAFLGAVIASLPPEESERNRSRVLIVHDAPTWNRLVATDNALILVPTFTTGDLIARAIRAGHRVLLSVGPSQKDDSSVVIPRPDRHALEGALRSMGINEARAQELSAVGRRSLLSLRRSLASARAVQQPDWARADRARSLLPALLAGQWRETDGDLETIGKLAGAPPQDVVNPYVQLLNVSDPPLRRTGDAWYLVSKDDAWALLTDYLSRADIDRFIDVAVDVLATPDPRYELPQEQRFAASVFGRSPKHSGLLRRGLSDTLALMGSLGDEPLRGVADSPALIAKRAVARVFEVAARRWDVWSSLADVMPALAEAAPEEFLGAIERGLDGNDPPVLRLFSETEDTLTSSSAHPSLLWSLECLAWSREHFAHTVQVLAELSRREPGGKLLNRPSASLREIFLPWHPQTSVDLDHRLQVLDTLRQREPDVAWNLMGKMLPEFHASASPTAKPKHRDWVPEQENVVPRDYGRTIEQVVQRMLRDVGTVGSRWKMLLHGINHLSRSDLDSVLSALRGLDAERLADNDRIVIWNTIREIVGQHRSFPDAKWVLDDTSLDEMAKLYPHFEPSDLHQKHLWLFSNRPALIEGRERDFYKHHESLSTIRQEAVRQIFEAVRENGLLDFASRSERPGEVGLAAGRAGILAERSEIDTIGRTLSSSEVSQKTFGRGLMTGVIARRGREWVNDVVANPPASWTFATRAEVLSFVPLDADVWRILERTTPDVRSEFWRIVPTWAIASADVVKAVRALLNHGRPYSALELLTAKRSEKYPPGLLVETLELLVRTPPAEDPATDVTSYEIGEAFDALVAAADAGQIEEQRVALLELAFLPLFRHDRRPEILHRELARNPELFADAVVTAYPGDGETDSDVGEEESRRAQLAHELLHSWRTLPGSSNGAVTAVTLQSWVDRVRSLLAAKNRREVGDLLIGQMLSGSRTGQDKAWPSTEVAAVLDTIGTEEVGRGFHMGAYNSRGVTSRALTEGGAQEWNLAKQYEEWAAKREARFPKTAAMLRSLGQTYRSEARREDASAELRIDLD